jgi:hypothetical protein
MLTFVQFITEYRDPKIGFLRPDNSPVEDSPTMMHSKLAKRYGFKGTNDALRHGWVRYHHNSSVNEFGKSVNKVAYEYKDHPDTRKLIAHHLATTGGFNRIDLDSHTKRVTNTPDQSHTFNSVEAARNHLGESASDILRKSIDEEWQDTRKLAFGYLRPGKQPIKKITRSSPTGHLTHAGLARKLGFGGENPIYTALKSGYIRYEHLRDPDWPKENYAGYEFHDTPQSRKLVADHLGKSGGFRDIRLDHHNPIGEIQSHWFNNVESAVKHLNN